MFKSTESLLVLVLIAVAIGARGSQVFADHAPSAIDFDTQVIPLLTRFGCNAGACHGAAIGRGGFKLSLFGSRPGDDHLAIVHELEGRRINLHDSRASLLLKKATETIEHGGGQRFDESDPAFTLLQQWIVDGGMRLGIRSLVRIDVTPKSVLLSGPGESVPVKVTATFNDGTVSDVTAVTALTSDDIDSVSIDEALHQMDVHRRGEHVVIARYLNQVQPIRIAVPYGHSVGDTAHAHPDGGDNPNPIDRWIHDKLSQLGIPVSPPADDYEFARRIWLDLTGRLPDLEELSVFVQDDARDKRDRCIDRLLNSNEFADYWALKWADVLGIDSKQLSPAGNAALHHWLAGQFRTKGPWNEAAYRMLTDVGDGFVDGPVNFLRLGNGPDGLAESATRIMMGVRLRCANCHDHPLDQWTQDDYHGLAAVFAKLNRGRVVSVSQRGEVTHPLTGLPAVPRIPGIRSLDAHEDGRVAFASWVTSESNPYFATATANRVWAQLMGRGLIDPVDDIRSTNPASHPELLAILAEQFSSSGYRFHDLIRMICTSDAYRRSSRPVGSNDSDQMYYSHFIRRGLEAEVIADAITDVTGVPIVYDDQGMSDAIRLTDNQLASEILDTLGRCDRSLGCESPALGGGSVSKVLHFLNGDLLNSRLESPGGNLRRWIATIEEDQDLIDTIYRRTLTRPPSNVEVDYWNQQIESIKLPDGRWPDGSVKRDFYSDLLWSLLTSETFLTNH